MNRRVALSGLVVLIGTAGFGLLVGRDHSPPEPMYRGRSLSSWLDARQQLTLSAKLTATNEPDIALRAIGPQAVPWLVAWLGKSDSWLALTVERLERGLGLPLVVESHHTERARAVQGFWALGPEARSGYREVVAITLNSGDLGQRLHANQALLMADVATVRLLAAGLQSPDPAVRLHAVVALASTRAAPDEVVIPALEAVRTDPDPAVRAEVAAMLAALNKNPEHWATWLTAPDPLFRVTGCRELAVYRSRARAHLPALINLTQDADPQVRAAATAAVAEIRGPQPP